MELKWLKDFVALVEHGSFSKAAASRFVTQPAFSRRIRSLESWMGVSLVDRDQYPTKLTPAGEAFIVDAHQLIDQIYNTRHHICHVGSSQEQLVFLSQHALSVCFFPEWMETIEDLMKGDSMDTSMVRVDAGNLHDMVETFLAGNSDFLLSYASTDIFNQLSQQGVDNLQLGTDELLPVCGVDAQGSALYTFDEQADNEQVIKLIAHPGESFFGKLILRDCLPYLPKKLTLHTICENALSEAQKSLVLKGHGIAWLPKSVILNELERGELIVLSDVLRSITLHIKLYRLSQSRHDTSQKFWRYLQDIYPVV